MRCEVLANHTRAVTELKEKHGHDPAKWTWGAVHTATFRHPLGVGEKMTMLFNIGPIARGGYGLTPFATGGPTFTQTIGATFRAIMDPSNWDQSVATSVPGPSGQPGSPHFADLTVLWGSGQYFALPYSRAAVNADAEATLTLTKSQMIDRCL